MSLKFTQVDAFTSEIFKGNPAAVCVMDKPADEAWMQKVAMEMNLSETAFLYREDDGFSLRWFTPVHEVDLCGHATLASAHVLWDERHLKTQEEAIFYTRSGRLAAKKNGDWIELNFPTKPAEEVGPLKLFEEAFGVKSVFTGKSDLKYLLEFESEQIIRDLKPDFNKLAQVDEGIGVIVTAKSTKYDFISRFFAPKYGINEDPVTGSAHCVLSHYWSKKLNKLEFSAYQASVRGGELKVILDGQRTRIEGQAVSVFRGEIL